MATNHPSLQDCVEKMLRAIAISGAFLHQYIEKQYKNAIQKITEDFMNAKKIIEADNTSDNEQILANQKKLQQITTEKDNNIEEITKQYYKSTTKENGMIQINNEKVNGWLETECELEEEFKNTIKYFSLLMIGKSHLLNYEMVKGNDEQLVKLAAHCTKYFSGNDNMNTDFVCILF